MTEPLVSSPRVIISETTSPAPPWAGATYVCWQCRATNQLEAGDQCESVGGTAPELYHVPACRCGYVNLVRIPQLSREEALASLKIGLEPTDDDDQVANPS